jgi:hypothetical protein
MAAFTAVNGLSFHYMLFAISTEGGCGKNRGCLCGKMEFLVVDFVGIS